MWMCLMTFANESGPDSIAYKKKKDLDSIK